MDYTEKTAMARLVETQGEHRGMEHPLVTVTRIGRSSECDIVAGGKKASRGAGGGLGGKDLQQKDHEVSEQLPSAARLSRLSGIRSFALRASGGTDCLFGEPRCLTF